jgi:poly-gamma-glutamate synthesis protein (capsule biosynthesis protein)
MAEKKSFSLRAVGDICLGGVEGDPFEHVSAELDADLIFGNLECCFARRGEGARKNVLFNADASSARWLRKHGFGVLCLANNHTLDFGPEGLDDTIGTLEGEGLTFVGAGRNGIEATAPVWVDANGARIAVVASADASGDRDDGPTVSVINAKALADCVRAVRADADVVVASFHGGIELETVPSPSFVRSLRSLVDAGADVVLAHHPHVLQPAEIYRDRVIAYSLGNFVFDNRRYGDSADLAATTTILDVHVALEGGAVVAASFAHIPVRIGADFKPRLMADDETESFRSNMANLESQLGTVDVGAVDVQRLESITREVHQKSFGTLVRYAVRHFRDYSFRELVVGGVMVLKGLFKRK